MRVAGRLAALFAGHRDARRVHGATAAKLFDDLNPSVVDAYFENFGWTPSLALIQQIVALCREHHPSLTVEFGAGVSTIALAEALAPHDGILLSVEEDPQWIIRTRASITRVERVVFVTVARHTEGEGVGHGVLQRVFNGLRPGLVVIDGPSLGDRFDDEARSLYRALFTARSLVAIDDTDRPSTDAAATELARESGLVKHDFADPLQTRQTFSLLLPPDIAVPDSAAVAVNGTTA